jgi:Methyltransferase FkbM domain
VCANSLDAVLAGKTPAIIKIDVEGAEGLVMRGAQKILDAKPIVFSELSAAAMNAGTVSAAEYISMLTKRGYSLFICQRDGTTNQVQAAELERASLDNVHGFLDFMALPAAT